MRLPLLALAGALSGALALASIAPAQTGTVDQMSPVTNAVYGGAGVTFPWQQQVRAGVSGKLEGIYFPTSQDPLGPSTMYIRVGSNTQGATAYGPVTMTRTGTPAGTTAWFFFDFTSFNIQLNAGDVYYVETSGSAGASGSYVAPPGSPLYPEPLYIGFQSTCFADCGWRTGFTSYMLSGPPTPTLAVVGATSGGTATATVSNATASSPVVLGYSLAGGGPVNVNAGCAVVTVSMTPPITQVNLTANAGGTASFSTNVPGGTTGVSVWTQAFDVASCQLTNGVMVTL